MAKLLEGKPLAEKIKQEIKQAVQLLRVKPVLASVLVGEDAAANVYVKSQERVAKDLGIDYQLRKLAANTPEDKLIELIKELNADKLVNGIIIQMPLPKEIDYKKIRDCVSSAKDVEGISPLNLGMVMLGKAKLVPCVAGAVMELLNSTGINLYGKEVVLVGWTDIVGKPLAVLLSEKLATVSICQISVVNIEEFVRKAEVLIVAVGKAGLIKGGWIKRDAVVIDVGINRVNGKIVGDVEFAGAEKLASYITPVPGGVGPLTVIMLMRNLVEAAKLQQG
ncbi:MAG TPA: bifunctional 5,10-methylenetetrahydrofolate dehydrogenase/5,10-methenyltetrahydrofolate cyclohydrolase [Candidatus Omnitrophota bacterium]|nr:bifunctional 5,10-methylenetetrahydrofolate dehydrogenase/5,10-methenyltetrahydrofolate cyclohydrolase [Candidatus Omnitrophota bacterium]